MALPLCFTCPWVACLHSLRVKGEYGLHDQDWALPHLMLCFISRPSQSICQRVAQQFGPGPFQSPDRRQACLHHAGDGFDHRLAVALSSVFVWLAAISALPHKEERFLYVVYPLVSSAII